MLPIPSTWCSPSRHLEEEHEEETLEELPAETKRKKKKKKKRRGTDERHKRKRTEEGEVLFSEQASNDAAVNGEEDGSRGDSNPTHLSSHLPGPPAIIQFALSPKSTMMHHNPSKRHASSDDNRSLATQSSPPSATALVESVKNAIRASRSFQRESALHALDLSCILSSTSYRQMMKQAFGGEAYIMPTGQQQQGAGASRDKRIIVPTVTRAYEESYMRQVGPGERECARGKHCECMFIDPLKPFVCVEFLTLEELRDPPEDRQLCVICCRKETQFLFYDMVCNKAVYNTVIQKYGNLSGPQEYASTCLLRSTTASELACMPKPIMSHQRNRYIVIEDPHAPGGGGAGKLRLQQLRVSVQDYEPSSFFQEPLHPATSS